MPILNEKMKEQQGLVISYFGNSVAIETDERQVIQCHLRRNQDMPVVGDRVIFQSENKENGIVKEILPRHSFLLRGSGHGQSKIIAANIDLMVIMMAPLPVFSQYLLDRYLVAAELLNIQPLIVLNKVDLLSHDEQKQMVDIYLKPYQNISYSAILSSIYYEETLRELNSYLKNKTSVFMGPSGVGKSSIIAILTHLQESVRVQEVSKKGAGKHTTTATHLYHLEEGGDLIDSPGVREFSLWQVSEQEILAGFREFQAFLGVCKFRDCKHLSEPSCAVQEAILKGKISKERFFSYQTLMKKVMDDKPS